eukprot:TRINITY_DN10654_c1_g5_i1.p1 TRINITY_DN10654_c1_g5~~TRINITY_DN10654_c1_g5_i1.p1  ORF type:complete len:1248 (-),score=231.10 TRINITY_DN10654_c1_g5_i1:50-3595(-)
MKAILRRLEICGDFQLIVFPEEVILGKPPREWPVVDCLISFASKGFPLEKCEEYIRLVNPCCINKVEAQRLLLSRTSVYRTLQEWCIPCPDHVIVDHTAAGNELIENENYIIFNGKKISKPFVEKPQDADRHDIWIYYPRNIGGGAKKLFRKEKDKSSDFDPNQNSIRRDGTYVYEPFLPTQGTDIKVYTVGAGYVHAEARKAPTVDGKVQRSKDGKEVRYPVVLTQGEKAIAAFIVKAFRQNICGFDILRTDGGSYVCDVNGWSFVKGNQKYYNDCATLIRKHLLDECGIKGVDTSTMMILGPNDEVVHDTGAEISALDYSMRESLVNRSPERLRSVIVVMRHGDRRPKEKMKFKTKQPAILSYFDGLDEIVAEVKLKTPEEFATLTGHMKEIARDLRAQLDGEGYVSATEKISEMKQELQNIELLIPVLEMKDRFAGLERKVQLKASKWKPQKDGAPRKAAQVLLVAKWGGELTVSGLAQSTELGKRLRHDLYPNDPTGLLRLHSSFRHDFKIYSSQEGRCQITAAAFTKGFLDLEGDIIPILASLVTRDGYAQGLLDEPIPKKQRDTVKQKIESLLMNDTDMSSPEVLMASCPTSHAGLREAARRIGSPLRLLQSIRSLAQEYIDSICAAKEEAFAQMQRQAELGGATHTAADDEDFHEDAHDDAVPFGEQVKLASEPWIPFDLHDSSKRRWLHLRRKENRWRKLLSGLVTEADNDNKGEKFAYDASKIPDVWDNLYYDMLTHRSYLGEVTCRLAERMVELIHPLNEWVCLSEYGISQEEKLRIGVDVTWRLIGKMLGDLEFMIEDGIGHIDAAGRRPAAAMSDTEGSSGTKETKGSPQIKKPGNECRIGVGSNTSLSSMAKQPLSPHGSIGLSASPSNSVGIGGLGSEQDCDDVFSSPISQSVQQWQTSFELGIDEASDGARKRPWRELVTKSSTDDGDDPVVSSQPLTNADDEDIQQSAPGPSANIAGGSQRRHSRFVPARLRSELTHALRDSSDWHPRLNDEVAKLTGIRSTRIVRSRIYVTSASTMHSLFNILRHAQPLGCKEEKIISDLGWVTDLNYLTHIVMRCYERDDDACRGSSGADEFTTPEQRKESEKARYRVEISLSPGVQVFSDGHRVTWPKGSDLSAEKCMVAPLQIVADSVELTRIERMFTDVVKQYDNGAEEETEDDKPSDNN